MAECIYYLNGKYLPASEAKVSVDDRGILLGDGVFEGIRTFHGKIFQLQEHMERFARSLNTACIDPGLSLSELEEISIETVRRNAPLRGPDGDFIIWPLVTRGKGFHLSQCHSPTVCVRLAPIPFDYYAPFYKTGARIVFSSVRSLPPQCLDPKLKHSSRLGLIMAEIDTNRADPEARPAMLDIYGNISEGRQENIFIVTNGVLRTPRLISILGGLTRETTIKLAQKLGIPCVEEDIQLYDAYNAQEVFMTNALYMVLPVSKIDGRAVRGELPGPITQKIIDAFSELAGLDIVKQFTRHLKA